MKSYIIVVAVISCISLQGQVLDTIYANDQKNVALFFPSPIRQGITGAEHFVFTYNREKEQYFGLLQAKAGIESNLLTITNDGQVYSYILKYAVTLPKLNYFIGDAESIGNEQPKKGIVKQEIVVNDAADKNGVTYYQKFSAFLLKRPAERFAAKRFKGVKLTVEKRVYQGAEVYLVLELKNASGVDFDINYLNVYSVSGTSKRKASFQKLQKEVLYKHNLPSLLKDNHSQRCVLVLPKFVLANHEKVQIELKERNGNRGVILNFK